MAKIEKTRFRVTGTQYYEKDLVEKLGEQDPDYNCSAAELKETYYDGDKIYEYDFSGLKAELVPEPENEYDKNAVKVIVNGVQVGYIKKGSCTRVKNLMASPDFAGVEVSISGGRYKYLCGYEDDNGNEKLRVEKDKQPFYVDIDILTREEKTDPVIPAHPAPAAITSHVEPAAPEKPTISKFTKIVIIAAIVILLFLFIAARL